MRLLFYNHTAQVSGAERMLALILKRLNRSHFDPVVVCPEAGPLPDLVRQTGTPWAAIPTLEARFCWRPEQLMSALDSFRIVIRRLRQQLLRLRPDLIHANSVRAGLAATAATIGLEIPVIWYLQDLLPRHPLSSFIRICAASSGKVRLLAISEAVAANFRGSHGLLAQPIKVIHNAIELERFEAGQVDRQAVRHELQLDWYDPVIGIIGYLAPSKGQLELIRAFAKVLKWLPRAVLLIVGAPTFIQNCNYLLELVQTVNRLGLAQRVRFVGPRDDIAEIMQALDLLVINSRTEGFGLVAVEAMASGTPVLATATGGLPEIIHHGETGWLIRPGDEQALVEAIVQLGHQPELRARLAASAAKQAKARFSAERYISELEEFYRSCCQTAVTPEARSHSGCVATQEER